MIQVLLLAALLSVPPMGGVVAKGVGKQGARASIGVTFNFTIGSASTLAYKVKDLGEGLYLVEYNTSQVGVREPKNYSGKEIIFDQRENRGTAWASIDMDGIHTKKNVIAMKWTDTMEKTMVARAAKRNLK